MISTEFPPKLFVAGTDTGVGKTVVSAILVAGLKGKYWKPVQSGLEEMTDTQWIQKVTGFSHSHFFAESYRLQRPLSPHASAAAENIHIELEAFQLPKTNDHLIVEGAGGIMVPLNEKHFMLDLMKKLNIPILLVARTELGTINHTLLSLEQLRRHGLDVFGVVMNGLRNPGNREAIEYFGKVKVLAEIEPMDSINSETLKRAFIEFGNSATTNRGGSRTSALQITQWHHSPVHVFLPDSFYIITASTLRKRHIFTDTERLQILQNTLFEVVESCGWRLQAWAVFPNHYHIIARSTDGSIALNRMIQRLHSLTARRVNELDQASGRKVWFQYWDTCLTYEESYLARLNYVHNNAVKHNITTAAEDYPFCSAGWFKNKADADFFKKVQSFGYDRIKIPDDF